jgi:hypothetical protein
MQYWKEKNQSSIDNIPTNIIERNASKRSLDEM